MEIVMVVLVGVMVVVNLIPLLTYEHWTVRFFDFPYAQFTVINVVILLLLVCFPLSNPGYHYLAFAALCLTLLYRLWIIYPYTQWAARKVPDADIDNHTHERLKIISANVLMSNDDYKGLIEMVKGEDPDILMLVEASHAWEEAIREDMHQLFPHRMLEPLDNTYGLLLYSKVTIKEGTIKYLIEENVPSVHIIFELKNGQLVKFFGVHPKPPSPSENSTSIQRDAELVMVGRESRESDMPVIVAGDLNDVAWSHTTRLFIRVSELLDPRMGRGFFNTFHAHYPLLRWPLDHLFLSTDFKVAGIKRLPNFHSDHFPICIEVVLNPSNHAVSATETTDQEDREEAQEKITDAKEITSN
ncbi:endonuclease/exonuclease/phosphatase family protein [Reichenbachiella sp. MSK19-1]|uniref:endonuclease/exonuclease/phosphatase family protein n=1 Tax=Reichenbachiella sp. MSK19-1 TaxID=1897631 RepID=UPI000E6C5DD5|nr:endonuclease/exonuclease/phosphatase family protein [Reichenbachiella sp. MSK19-1]RJE74614.1 hypothetical protein BGP76_15850 [Reichenbachiella sp. MSK19-1]